jgi:signal transduction histidine kinase
MRFLAVPIIAGFAVLLLQGARMSRMLIESKALLDAELYADAIDEFRSLYTSEVVERLAQRGVPVTHDYLRQEGAIPLPATLSMLLGERLGQQRSGASTRLYSPYPFPWRSEGGLRDEFARKAWAQLSRDPQGSFYELDRSEAGSTLRYARADRMRPACVRCHNSHAQSPKRDWETGEVRGVLEVRIPINRIEAQARVALQEGLLLTGLMGLLGTGLLALIVGRLRRTSVELEQSVVDLRRNHDELSDAHDALVRARDEALAASRAKSEFLAVVSHELKTPLNAIIGYSEMLEEELDTTQRAELGPDLKRIHGAARHLGAQIDDILDFSRLEAGAPAELGRIGVAELVSQATSATPGLREGTVGFELRLPENAGDMTTDVARLRKALYALLANALKFTERGRITLGVTRELRGEVEWVCFAVQDTGIGMTAEQLAVVGRPFTQADGSATRRRGGTGLGLALVRSIAHLLGGSLAVVSEPGSGSTFTLCVPARSDTLAAEPAQGS